MQIEDKEGEEHEAEVETAPEQPAIEAEALEMGWVPKDRFKGDPEKWRPAEEFVQRGKELLPIVNKRLEKEQQKVSRLESKLDEAKAEFKAQLDGLKKATREALKTQRDQLKAEYEAKKEKAVETGDTEAYRKAVADETKAMERLADKAEEEKTETKETPKLAEEQKEWFSGNPWFGDKLENGQPNPKYDAKLTVGASAIANEVEIDMPAAPLKEKLAEIDRILRERYPDKFGRKGTNGSSRVEGGSRVQGDGTGRSKWSQLSADFKQVGDSFIKDDGLFLNKGETADTHLAAARERYAASVLADMKE